MQLDLFFLEILTKLVGFTTPFFPHKKTPRRTSTPQDKVNKADSKPVKPLDSPERGSSQLSNWGSGGLFLSSGKFATGGMEKKTVEGSSAHTNQDHLRTQPRIIATHTSGSSAPTDQDHLRTHIRTPTQSCFVGWGGVGWGGDNNKPWRLTRT